MEDAEFIRAYVAGAIDSGSSINVWIKRDDSYSVGFSITPVIEVVKQRPELPDFLMYWGKSIGVKTNLKRKEGLYRWTVLRRDDIREILERIGPYLMVYDEAANIMLEELIPRLEDRTHTTKAGFVETMGYVDSLRHASLDKNQSKYDQGFFKNRWSDEL